MATERDGHNRATSRAAAALCLIGLMLAPARAAAAGFDHVRSEDAYVRALLDSGYARSATFKALVDELDSRPGIVYIVQAVALSRGMDGALLHAVAGSPEIPMFRVLLKTNLGRDYAVAVLAHELQHVLEVLRAGRPMDSAAMAEFFAALDDQAADSKFETEDARAITSRVLDELRVGRRRR